MRSDAKPRRSQKVLLTLNCGAVGGLLLEKLFPGLLVVVMVMVLAVVRARKPSEVGALATSVMLRPLHLGPWA